jgi:hypothetical protein
MASWSSASMTGLRRWKGSETAGNVRRAYFMEKRGEGVPIILRESETLSGRKPVYQLIDDTELKLTIYAAQPQ